MLKSTVDMLSKCRNEYWKSIKNYEIASRIGQQILQFALKIA